MKKLFLFSILLLIGTQLFAFDGERKGFILGLGLGGSGYSFTQTIDNGYSSSTTDPESDFGLATDFTIGFAPNNQLELFYSSKVTWLEMVNIYNEEVTITSGIAGFGISYHFVDSRTWSPNLFVNGSVGFSTWTAPFESGSDIWIGTGFTCGIGFEFIKHCSLLASIKYGSPETTVLGLTETTDTIAADILFNVLAY